MHVCLVRVIFIKRYGNRYTSNTLLLPYTILGDERDAASYCLSNYTPCLINRSIKLSNSHCTTLHNAIPHSTTSNLQNPSIHAYLLRLLLDSQYDTVQYEQEQEQNKNRRRRRRTVKEKKGYFSSNLNLQQKKVLY